jgi:hypothetical protein
MSQLPISIQAVADQQGRPFMFTRRPAAFHAEIRGLSGDVELPPIEKLNDNSLTASHHWPFMSESFESGTPVPVDSAAISEVDERSRSGRALNCGFA